MFTEGKVGENRAAQGTQQTTRLGAYSETIVGDAHGKYFEAARLGRLYTTFVRAVTIAATHNTPIAAATATPVLALLNPVNNNKAMSIQRVSCGTSGGTPQGGQWVLNFVPGPGTTITTAATGNIFNHLLPVTGSPSGSTMKPFNNVALTGISPTIGYELSLIGQTSAGIGTAGNTGPAVSGEDLSGSIIVQPNTLIALMCGTGAGTSWVVNASITWEEIDWPL